MTRARRIGLGLLALAGPLAGCAGTAGDGREATVPETTPASASVPVDTLYAAEQSGFAEPRLDVVRDAEAWAEAWRRMTSLVLPSPAAPEVDFGAHVVVVAATGTRPSGGYAIGVDGVRREGDRLLVTILETVPGPGCLTTQALTAPVVAVAIPGPADAVEFVERTETRTCAA